MVKSKQKAGGTAKQKIALILLISGIVLFSALYLMENKKASLVPYSEIENRAAGEGILSIPDREHNFGTVKLSGGIVSTTFPLVNIGEGDLTIDFLDTSCGCTSANIVNGDEVGPQFGMASHGNSSKTWKTTIKPGGQAELRVYYDPSVHPNFKGSATREINIYSDDKYTRKKTVKIRVYQTK